MKKTLIASGCSWTNKNFKSDFHHDMDCSWPKWPELLAKKLDMECINLGRSGAGNEYIYSSLLDQIIKMDPNNIGLVMPAWSQSQRFECKRRGIWKHNIKLPDYAANSIAGNIDKSLIYYYSLQEICKSKKIPLKQLQMLPIFRSNRRCDPNRYDIPQRTLDEIAEGVRILYNNPYFNNIDNNFIGWPTEKRLGGFNFCDDILDIYADETTYCISDLDKHPNAEGQEKIAEYIYDWLG